jgi:hypothetical protein
MEGRNTFVYGRSKFSERQLDQADLALPPVRLELWGGSAWINHDDEAPSFRDTLGPLADRLEAREIDKMRAEWCYATVLPANWKIAMEAFMEGLHIMRTHPQLYESSPHLFASMYEQTPGSAPWPLNAKASARDTVKTYVRYMEVVSEGMAGMIHAKDVGVAHQLVDVALPEDPAQAFAGWYSRVRQELTRQGRAGGEPTPDLNALAVSHPVYGVEYLFPHCFMLPILTSMSAYRIRPLGPESCYFEIWSLTLFPEGQEPAPVMDPVVLPYDSPDFPPIPQQDYSNIPRQQVGLHAEGFEFMRLGKDVEGLISNYQRVIDAYLAGEDLRRIAPAIHQLAGNFDGPIKELGL